MPHPLLLRSVLYVPASNERALAKIATLNMDAAVLDLEDAVAPQAKEVARENLRRYFKTCPASQARLAVRMNGFGTKWGNEDFLAARACKPDAIILPKVESPQDILTASDALAETDAPDSIKLWAMIETPRGVMNLAAIATLGAHGKSRLECLVAGSNGLMRATGARTRAALTAWLAQILIAARAGGLAALDGVFNNVGDIDGFEAECAQARDLGFDGKMLIHPDQIEGANRLFAPGPLEVENANVIVNTFESPENRGRNVLALNGRMVERQHYEIAKGVLARARAIEDKHA
jgi:citrate lyase subunit beta / citryl-CoA lyase